MVLLCQSINQSVEDKFV